jgi:hypothetical protein
MSDKLLETIVEGLEPIALIIRNDYDESGLHFFTPDSFSQQVAFMKHPQGYVIQPHVHNLVPRQVLYTQEVLIIKKGKVEFTFYTSKKVFLSKRILKTGDIILLCGGGHSMTMLEETSMIEVKQGPYAGDNDKIKFEANE